MAVPSFVGMIDLTQNTAALLFSSFTVFLNYYKKSRNALS
jgi:hypothetical protein